MNKFFIAAIAATFALTTACDKTETPGKDPGNQQTNPLEVRFSANIDPMSLTRVANDKWASDGGDQVGIFMKRAGATLHPETGQPLAQNVAYRVVPNNQTNTATLQIVTGQSMIQYPTDDSAVDFVSYYPYTSQPFYYIYTNGETVDDEGNTITTNGREIRYGIYVSGMNEQGYAMPQEILYSKVTNVKASANAVSLPFKYSLAKIVCRVTAAEGTALDQSHFSGMIASVDGIYGSGYLDFDSGTIRTDVKPQGYDNNYEWNNKTQLSMVKTPAAAVDGVNAAAFEALIIPVAGPLTFSFSINGGQAYTKTVTAVSNYEAGYVYTIPFELDIETPTYIGGTTATITARVPGTSVPTQTVTGR